MPLEALKRRMFDIRPGEHLRTWFMFAYLLFVLFAYYILKPVSRAMFLNRFDIDRLPSLYILIAVFGGLLAYFYSRLAARTSLQTAVFWAMALSVASLVGMWWLIRMRLAWMIYVLNIWVSLFAIVLVSQGWLVASNLFDAREARRLYPLLSMGMILGAALGGEFTSRTAMLVGTKNLLLASAAMVVLAYIAFRLAISQGTPAVRRARAGEAKDAGFSFAGMVRDIVRRRHLQVIVALMFITYLVDVFVEYQFQATAQLAFHGDQLTAFFGRFYGLYLNGAELVLGLFVTAAVVRRFGVGGTLQIVPAAVSLCSLGTLAAPGVASAGAVRLTEASTRYTVNKTGMELLYMPLPLELRNRVKAFIDIFMDRFSRGVGGVLLLLLTATSLDVGIRGLATIVMCLCVPWILLSYLARREYVATIRRRLAARRLELASVRVTAGDSATVRLLEAAAAGENPRQAAYALELLADAPHYDIRPLLQKLMLFPERPGSEVRRKVFGIAADLRFDRVLEQAMDEIRAAQSGGEPAASAVPYVLAVAPNRARLAAGFLEHPNAAIANGAVAGLRADPELARQLITPEWLARNARSMDSRRRRLTAAAAGVLAGGTEVLHGLMEDADRATATEACRSAGLLRHPAYLFPLMKALGNAGLRGEAIRALSAYGPAVCGQLAGLMLDETVPLPTRLQVPRVLKNIRDQRSVDVLLAAIGHPDLAIRASVLKALNHLRENGPDLNFGGAFVTEQILREARYYFEMNAALEPFRDHRDGGSGAPRLLARTIEDRLRATLERLFRLLGLRYPPKEIYSAYLAVSRPREDEHAAALEFLDSVLDRHLKRFLLPLLDAPEHVLEHGRELFGVDVPSAEEAIRELIRSRDPWLAACAMAAAAELKLHRLASAIALAAGDSEEEVSEVARSAETALAA